MTRLIKVVFMCLSALAMGCASPTLREISVEGWIAADVDVSVGYVRTPDGGLYAWDEKLYPFRPEFYGWENNGPVFPVKQFPEYLLVSWRLPPPGETQYERCVRRRERQENRVCESLPGLELGWRALETGQLIGPIKVPINLSQTAKDFLERKGSHYLLRMGVTYGLEKPKIRWILEGKLPEMDGTTTRELTRGGDW
jgi:hypothetical protein